MAEKLTIQFSAQGGGALKKTINDLHLANVQLTKGQAAFVTAQKQVQTESNKTSKGLFSLNHDTRNLSGAFSTLRSKLLIVSFGLALVAKPIKDLMTAISDMEETLSKANVVFGDNISLVKEWASALGNSVGRADSTLITMASTLQDTFVPLGYTREAATQLSTSLTELALDVASFNNQADDEVLKAFQSAIVGNHETVRKFGIVITEGKLKQEAFNIGLTDTVRELTAAEKVQARVSLITKGSADAVGDLSRTQGSLANQTKALSEEVKEAYEEIGKALEPVFRTFVKLARAMADPAVYKRAVMYIGAIATAWVLTSGAISKAKKAMDAFFAKLTVKTAGLYLLAIAIGELVYRMSNFGDEADDTAKDLADIQKQIDDNVNSTNMLTNATANLTTEIATNIKEIKYQISILNAKRKAIFSAFSIEKRALELTKERAGGLSSLSDEEQRYLEILNGAQATLDKVTAKRKAQLDIEIELFGSDLLKRKQQSMDIIIGKNAEVEQSTINSTAAITKANEAITLATNNNVLLSHGMGRIEKKYGDITKATSNAFNALKDESNQIDDNVEKRNKQLEIAEKYKKLRESVSVFNKNHKQYRIFEIKALEEAKRLLKEEIEPRRAKVIEMQKEYDALKLINNTYVQTKQDHQDNIDLIKEQKAILEAHNSVIDKNSEEYKENEAVIAKLNKSIAVHAEELHKMQRAQTLLQGFGEAFSVELQGMDFNLTGMMGSMLETFQESLIAFDDKSKAFNDALMEAGMQIMHQVMSQAQAHIDGVMKAVREAYSAQKKLNQDIATDKLNALKGTRKYNRMTESEQKRHEKVILDERDKADKIAQEKANKQLAKEFKKKQDMSAVSTIMDTASAIMKVTSQTGIAAPPWIALYSAMGAAQLAMIYSQKPPKAATGGLIGGNRHSQGGTMIEAEQGEFIMNRDAVDSVGIETMNRINQGGGGGSINISFAGNVLSKDFIEDEAVPQIKEALRRGGDLGIS